MRIALTAALMMVAAMALADEPSAPESSSTEAATQAPSDTAAEQQRAATETETTAKAEKPFKPPAGYKAKRVNGEQVWCQKTVILGSKFPKEDCRNEAQLREIARSRASMREELGRGRACVDCTVR
jgi:hypothetical protein